jgi:hypothetical protein
MTCATAGFGLAPLAFTETGFGCETPFATGAAVGLTRTPTIGALLPAGTALGATVAGFTAEACAEIAFAFGSTLAGLAAAALTVTAFAAGAGDALFVAAEIVFAFGPATAGFPEAVAEAAFAVDTVGLTETAFGVEVEGFVAGVAFTETAAFDFGVALVALAFAPFGEGFPACAVWVVAGCTLTVAGAAGFCTAVGVCANAAADRSMSVPRVRII